MIDSVGLLVVSLGMNGDVPSAIYLLLVNFTRSYNYWVKTVTFKQEVNDLYLEIFAHYFAYLLTITGFLYTLM